MAKLPVVYRKSPTTSIQADFVDTFTGVGYVRIYMCAGDNNNSGAYFLTTDNALEGHESHHQITMNNNSRNFDLDVKKSVIVPAAKGYWDGLIHVDTGSTMQLTYTIKRVDSSGTETTIGTSSGASLTGGAGAEYFIENVPITCTKTIIKPGEKLRLTIDDSENNGGATDRVYADPSGFWTETEGSITYKRRGMLVLPVEIPD